MSSSVRNPYLYSSQERKLHAEILILSYLEIFVAQREKNLSSGIVAVSASYQ
jgi:hypothetical protein